MALFITLGLISRPSAKMLSLAQHADYAQHLSVYAVSCTVHTCEPSGGNIFLPILRVPPVNFQNLPPWKKSSTIKSWPTFCDQYFWKFPIWNSRTDEKRREIQMVKMNVIFNDIRLLICLTPLQVNWVMVIN